MTFKLLTYTNPEGVECQMGVHIPSFEQFHLTDDNPICRQYLAWLAEGNTPEEWNPNAN